MSEKTIDGQYRTPNPEFRICLFYKGGDTNREPNMALVTKEPKLADGKLDLLVLGGGRSQLPISSVRHCDDTFFEYMPEARNVGVWDYLEAERPAKQKPLPPKSKAKDN